MPSTTILLLCGLPTCTGSRVAEELVREAWRRCGTGIEVRPSPSNVSAVADHPRADPDPKHPEETAIEGTILYCQDLGVEPEDIVMLAVAWLTKAPTMGRFAKKGWIDGWKEVRCVRSLTIRPS